MLSKNRMRKSRFIIVLVVVLLFFLNPKPVYAEEVKPTEPITIVSPASISLNLQSGVSNTSTKVTLKNISTQTVIVNFCLILGESKTCSNEYTSVGITTENSTKLSIQPVDPNLIPISETNLTIDSGKIRTFILKVDLSQPKGNVFPEEWENGYLVVETTNIPNTINSSIPIVLKENTLVGFSKIAVEFLNYINPNRIILFSAVLSFFICAFTYLKTVGVEGYNFERYLLSNVKNTFLIKEKNNKKQNVIQTDPLLRFRMGINKWKSGESWASSFVIGVGTIAALSEFLQPEETIITQESWKLFSIIIAIISAIPSFIFKSTTEKLNLVEEGDKDGREGYILYWLFTDGFITSLALLAQIGIIELFFETIRNNPENTISNIIINYIEVVILLFLFYCAAFYLPHRIKEVIKSQGIKEQTKNLSAEHIYLNILKKIMLLISSYLNEKNHARRKYSYLSIKKKIQNPILHTYIPKMQRSLEYYELTKKINSDDYSTSEDPIVSTLFSLFSVNLDILLKGCNTDKDIQQKLAYILGDVKLCYKLLNQRDKPEVARIALFNTLNFPPIILKNIYVETKIALLYAVDIAIAQLSSEIELDKVLDCDQQLFPTLERIIEETNKKLADSIDNPIMIDLNRVLFLEGKKELMTAKNPEELKTSLAKIKQAIEEVFDKELEQETNTLRIENKYQEKVLSDTKNNFYNLKSIFVSEGKDFTDIQFRQIQQKKFDNIDEILESEELIQKLQNLTKSKGEKDIYILAKGITDNSSVLRKNQEATRINVKYLALQSSKENREERSQNIERLINTTRLENPPVQLKSVSRL